MSRKNFLSNYSKACYWLQSERGGKSLSPETLKAMRQEIDD